MRSQKTKPEKTGKQGENGKKREEKSQKTENQNRKKKKIGKRARNQKQQPVRTVVPFQFFWSTAVLFSFSGSTTMLLTEAHSMLFFFGKHKCASRASTDYAFLFLRSTVVLLGRAYHRSRTVLFPFASRRGTCCASRGKVLPEKKTRKNRQNLVKTKRKPKIQENPAKTQLKSENACKKIRIMRVRPASNTWRRHFFFLGTLPGPKSGLYGIPPRGTPWLGAPQEQTHKEERASNQSEPAHLDS